MGIYLLLMILGSTVVLSLLFYLLIKTYDQFDIRFVILSFAISFFSGLLWNVIFDFKNDRFDRPLKETLHIEYKNGVPTDTTYTYE